MAFGQVWIAFGMNADYGFPAPGALASAYAASQATLFNLSLNDSDPIPLGSFTLQVTRPGRSLWHKEDLTGRPRLLVSVAPGSMYRSLLGSRLSHS